VLREMEQLLLANLHALAPASLLGKALHYLSRQWPKLTRFIENGAWPVDNNPCENAIRPFVVGRRNWLFADTVGVPRPVPTCTPSSKPARPTASIRTNISSPYSGASARPDRR
jgi:hypothetical protein